MVEMTADAMEQAPVTSRFGKLPASDTELNGDYLQTLTRLAVMTGDTRFLHWARRNGDAYIEEVLPANFGVPGMQWDFTAHTGDRRLRLRDHGNETIVGLTLLFTIERQTRFRSRTALSIRSAAHARSCPLVGETGRHALQRS